MKDHTLVGAVDTVCASSAYDLCEELFEGYPLAVVSVDWTGTVHSMVLMVHEGDGADFFMLARHRGGDEPFYSLSSWQEDGPVVDIEADEGVVPEVAAAILRRCVPLPRHGSLFGWLPGSAVSALVAVYADYTPEYPEPSWAVLPLAGAPARSWPPFTGEEWLGPWFWEHYKAGKLVSLAALVAANPDTVFWVRTAATLGWDCCVVSRDVTSDACYELPRGCYLYYEALRAGVSVPSAGELLSGPGKTDLAPRLTPLTDIRGQVRGLP
jgi:hypothetical protein